MIIYFNHKAMDTITNKRQLDDFVDYVWSFYGSDDDSLYPIEGLTKLLIHKATSIYFKAIISSRGNITWGDGDSLDRERVRDILTGVMGMTIDYNPQKGITVQDLKDLALWLN